MIYGFSDQKTIDLSMLSSGVVSAGERAPQLCVAVIGLPEPA